MSSPDGATRSERVAGAEGAAGVGRKAPPVEWTLVALAFRQLLRGRRLLAAAAFAALPGLLALLIRRAAGGHGLEPEHLVQLQANLVVPVILPLAALVFGTAVFGSEIEDGTLPFILAKPVARWRIALARIGAAALLTAAVVVPSAVMAGFIQAGGPERIVAGFAGAAAVGALVYCALFVAFGLTLRRPLLAGLAYVILWEGMLSDLFIGTRVLSVRQQVLALAEAFARSPEPAFEASLAWPTAVVVAVLLTAGASFVAVHRLHRFELPRPD
jgi:ABC-2 type transport system permease protein